MNVSKFIEEANSIASSNTVYAYGCIGQILTLDLIDQKAKQYPSWYTVVRKKNLMNKIGSLAFDCSGLIKYIMRNEKFPDHNADTIFKEYCDIVKVPYAGCLAHKSGHIGICLNEHQVIEASSKSGKVIISNNNERNWAEFGYFRLLGSDTNQMNEILSDLKKIIERYGG